MIHRLALLMGGTGAAGVLAVALALGGFGSPLSNSPDAFLPVSNSALAGGQRAAQAPTDQPTMTTSLGGGAPQDAPKKVIDTVYVMPAPAVVHSGKPASHQPADKPRNAGDGTNAGDDNGGNQAGDDQTGDDQDAEDSNDDDQSQAGEDDQSNDADQSDDSSGDDGGYESGDD